VKGKLNNGNRDGLTPKGNKKVAGDYVMQYKPTASILREMQEKRKLVEEKESLR